MATARRYDYPTLFRLLYQLGKAAGIERLYHNRVSMLRSVTREWSAAFAEYTSRLPTYYWTPLRQALMRCDLNNHVPNLGRDGLGYTRALRNNLKRLKQLGMAALASLQAACNSDIAVRGVLQHAGASLGWWLTLCLLTHSWGSRPRLETAWCRRLTVARWNR